MKRFESRKVRVTIEGDNPSEDLVFCSAIADLNWEDMEPVLPNFSDPWQMQRFQESNEKRKHLVDLISANIASALTQALWRGTK